MRTKRKAQLLVLAAMPVLFLASCSLPGVKQLTKPLVDNALVGAMVNPGKLTEGSRTYLEEQGLYGAYRKNSAQVIGELQEKLVSDPSMERRLSLIELCSDEGARLETKDPNKAAGYFLSAADLAFDIGANQTGSESETVREKIRAAYNFSAGRTAEILFNSGHSWDEKVTFEGPWKTYQISTPTTGDALLDPDFFDTLKFADFLAFKKIELERIRRDGVGAAMVGHRKLTPERKETEPFLPPVGMSLPINVTLDYSQGSGQVELAFRDLTLVNELQIANRTRPLAADMTAPLALLFNYSIDQNAAWKGMRHPEEYLDKIGLFQLEPFRPDQIPVIMVHGLVSSPEIWLPALNRLRADPEITKRYQLFVFRYPTGFPIAYSAATLRKRLKEFQDHFDPNRTNPNMRNMILVGHSMGAVLSSMQIRDSGDTMTSKMFTRPIDELDVAEEQKAAFKDLLIYESNPDVTRAVLIAGPHRGSQKATGAIGNFGRSLIKFPTDLLFSAPLLAMDGLTDLGREIAMDRPDGIESLKPYAPGLMAVQEQPIRKGVKFHSIIGHKDLSNPLEDSSDGTVPYWSSHLDGAASEAVYNDTHTPLTRNPKTMEEVRRILYLHAGLPYQAAKED